MVGDSKKFKALAIAKVKFVIATYLPVIALTRNFFAFAEKRVGGDAKIGSIAFDIGGIVSVGIERIYSQAATV